MNANKMGRRVKLDEFKYLGSIVQGGDSVFIQSKHTRGEEERTATWRETRRGAGGGRDEEVQIFIDTNQNEQH